MASSIADVASDRPIRELSLCQPCLLDEETKDATGYCVDCVEGLCDSCIKYHRRNKASRNHDVIIIVNDKSKSQVVHCLNEIFRCNEHSEFDVEKYCEYHKQYVCSVCLSTTHQSCKNVTEGCNKSPDFTLVEKLSGDIGQKVAKYRQTRQANESQIRDTCESIACERNIIVGKLRKKVDEMDKKLKLETEMLLQSELDNLCADLKDCDEIEERRTTLMDITGSLKKCGITKKSHVLEHEMENMLRTMKGNILNKKLTQIEFVKRDNVLVSLGTVKKVTYSELELGSTCADSIEDEGRTTAKTAESNATAVWTDEHKGREHKKKIVPLSKGNCTLFRKYSVGKENLTADVSAIVSLRNGWLVVADKANNKLKVFTDKAKPAYAVACGYSPLSMCMIADQDIFVIFSDTNRIQRYRLHTSFAFENGQFFTGRKCRDITYYDNNVALLVHGVINYEIEIRRVSNGQILKNIKEFTSISKSDIELENPSRIMYLQTEALFLVAKDGIVHCFNEEGDEQWFYKQYKKENKIETVTGLAVDDEDNVYVCCQGSENVHQVALKNFRQHMVILSDMTDVKAIAFNTSEKSMYVSFAGCDEIICYRFES